MPQIQIPKGLPGITGLFASVLSRQAMREMAEILLRAPSSLASDEREMIATFVSSKQPLLLLQEPSRRNVF